MKAELEAARTLALEVELVEVDVRVDGNDVGSGMDVPEDETPVMDDRRRRRGRQDPRGGLRRRGERERAKREQRAREGGSPSPDGSRRL